MVSSCFTTPHMLTFALAQAYDRHRFQSYESMEERSVAGYRFRGELMLQN